MKIRYNNLEDTAKVSPVLVAGVNASEFENAVVLSGDINSKELGIVNESAGLRKPEWLKEYEKKGCDTIVIDGIDKVDVEEQEKFFELIKYKTISSVEFEKSPKIIVIYKNIDKVSQNISSLCAILF